MPNGRKESEVPKRCLLFQQSVAFLFRVVVSRSDLAAEVLRLHSPNALPYCAALAEVDHRVGCGSTDWKEWVWGLKL